MSNYNRRSIRLLISLLMGMPAYAIFALIRNFPFSSITLYAFVEYGLTASVAFFLVFEIQELKSRYLNKVISWENNVIRRLIIELTSSFLITSFFVLLGLPKAQMKTFELLNKED